MKTEFKSGKNGGLVETRVKGKTLKTATKEKLEDLAIAQKCRFRKATPDEQKAYQELLASIAKDRPELEIWELMSEITRIAEGRGWYMNVVGGLQVKEMF